MGTKITGAIQNEAAFLDGYMACVSVCQSAGKDVAGTAPVDTFATDYGHGYRAALDCGHEHANHPQEWWSSYARAMAISALAGMTEHVVNCDRCGGTGSLGTYDNPSDCRCYLIESERIEKEIGL
jgi:hypothetical protein